MKLIIQVRLVVMQINSPAESSEQFWMECQ